MAATRQLLLPSALALAFALALFSASSPGGGRASATVTACNASSNHGLWFNYTCACQSIGHGSLTYSTPYRTCPGLMPFSYGRRAFGNAWLDSVGYSWWIDELMTCANRPFRGGFSNTCLLPGIRPQKDVPKIYVGGGRAPRWMPGKPWNYNPEPPYTRSPFLKSKETITRRKYVFVA